MVKYCSRWETNCEIVKHEDTIKKKGRRYVNTEALEYLETSNAFSLSYLNGLLKGYLFMQGMVELAAKDVL